MKRKQSLPGKSSAQALWVPPNPVSLLKVLAESSGATVSWDTRPPKCCKLILWYCALMLMWVCQMKSTSTGGTAKTSGAAFLSFKNMMYLSTMSCIACIAWMAWTTHSILSIGASKVPNNSAALLHRSRLCSGNAACETSCTDAWWLCAIWDADYWPNGAYLQ